MDRVVASRLAEYVERYRRGGAWDRDVDHDTYLLLRQFGMDWRGSPAAPAAVIVRHIAKQLGLTDHAPRIFRADPVVRFTANDGPDEHLYLYDPIQHTFRRSDDGENVIDLDVSKLEDGVLRMYAQTQARLSDEDRQLYRGMFGKEVCKFLEPGALYKQPQFSSWTPDESKAAQYASGLQSGLEHLAKAHEEGSCRVVFEFEPVPRDIFVGPESAPVPYWESDERVLLGRDYEVTSVEPGDPVVARLQPLGLAYAYRAADEELALQKVGLA